MSGRVGFTGLLLSSLPGCGLLEVGPANEITEIEPAAIHIRVVELGPLNPERVAFPSDAPITEFLPGDRVRFEIEVVDVDGLALADERLDSVWLLDTYSGFGSIPTPFDDPSFDQRCDELEDWSLMSTCRLGDGSGSIEFEVPPLGETLEYDPDLAVYVALAWDGQRAEDCWEARRHGDAIATNCEFVRFWAPIGPPWWLMAHAASQGVTTPIPVSRFPAPVFLQQANRVPIVEELLIAPGDETTFVGVPVVDGVAGPIAVEPGERLQLMATFDENLQFSQVHFYVLAPRATCSYSLPNGSGLGSRSPVRSAWSRPGRSASIFRSSSRSTRTRSRASLAWS